MYLADAGLTAEDDERSSKRTVPVLTMLTVSRNALQSRAEKIIAALDHLPVAASIGRSEGESGGGTLPRSKLPSVVVELVPERLALAQLASKLRQARTPVIGYISEGRFKLDLRTIFPCQDQEVIHSIRSALE
jgi:L-seryl-tRNA(Ser) seleniumtransferase